MDHLLLVIVIAVVVFILVVIIALLFRYTFVFGSEFGAYTTKVWTNCSASECNGQGTQKLISKCRPNPRTGAGCINENGEQTYEDKIYEEKTCTAICPATQQIIISEGQCINGKRDITWACESTGYNGVVNCTPGNVTTISELCPVETIGSWSAQYPTTNFAENAGCEVGAERSIYTLLAEGYLPTPLPCLNGQTCDPSGFYSCVDPQAYTNGYNYVSNCIRNGTVVTPNICRLYPITQIPNELEDYIYRPFYFRDETRGYLSASGPNNVFYSQSGAQAILLYFIPRSATQMIFLVGAFGNAYFLSFSEMVLRPVAMQLNDGGMTTGLAPRYTVNIDGALMNITGYASGTIELQGAETGFNWIIRTGQ